MAEIDPLCCAVLKKRFPNTLNAGDVRSIQKLPNVDILTAGFPCQPYSPAGDVRGLRKGRRHIAEIFRLLRSRRTPPSCIVLENVPFIVHLSRGSALRRIVCELEELGYSWAYRIVDTRSFGIPHRRRRWILVASRDIDAARLLFDEARSIGAPKWTPGAYGFYWTEGTRGVGWTDDAIPPLKVGSGFGIPSTPAVWDTRSGAIITPDVRDAERLQGFPVNWTAVPKSAGLKSRDRWRAVGNAVSVPTAEWIAHRIESPGLRPPVDGTRVARSRSWPSAAYGHSGRTFAAMVSEMPVAARWIDILSFLRYEGAPLSHRATRGFRIRFENSRLRKDTRFIDALHKHERHMSHVSKP